MSTRRNALHIAGCFILLPHQRSWAKPGDWQTSLGTPLDLIPSEVQIRQATFKERSAVAVELTAEAQRRSLRSGGNAPTFAVLNNDFVNGTIEVDIAGSINGKGDKDSRAFVGIAFHVAERGETFDAVYLRMTNGTKNMPPPPSPRDVRAVQYVAHPDFHFDVSRSKFPQKYEKAALVALDTWHRMRLDVDGTRLRVAVDGAEVLAVDDLRFANRKGAIGLFVDDGTVGYFSNLSVKPRAS